MAPLSTLATPYETRSRSRGRSLGRASISAANDWWHSISSHSTDPKGAVDACLTPVAASTRAAVRRRSAIANALVQSGSMGTAITIPTSLHASQSFELGVDTPMVDQSSTCDDDAGASIRSGASQESARALQVMSELFDFDDQDFGNSTSTGENQESQSSCEGAVARDFVVNIKVHVKDSDEKLNQRALLDTGTMVNLMVESFARETHWPIEPSPDDAGPLICGNGTELTPHGLITVDLYFADKTLRGAATQRVTFFICPDTSPFKVLLGSKFISGAKLFRYNAVSLVLHREIRDKKAQVEREKVQQAESEGHLETHRVQYDALWEKSRASTAGGGGPSCASPDAGNKPDEPSARGPAAERPLSDGTSAQP